MMLPSWAVTAITVAVVQTYTALPSAEATGDEPTGSGNEPWVFHMTAPVRADTAYTIPLGPTSPNTNMSPTTNALCGLISCGPTNVHAINPLAA